MFTISDQTENVDALAFLFVILFTDSFPHIELVYLVLFKLFKLYSKYPLTFKSLILDVFMSLILDVFELVYLVLFKLFKLYSKVPSCIKSLILDVFMFPRPSVGVTITPLLNKYSVHVH